MRRSEIVYVLNLVVDNLNHGERAVSFCQEINILYELPETL